ncbi:MAG: TetR/AcrR family transcriptional regulator [Alphaproteobacteria bacterium]
MKGRNSGQKLTLKQAGACSAEASPKAQAIIDAATRLFIEYGFARVSVDRIAHTANVSKATVYNNFEDKQHVFRVSMEILGQKVCPVTLGLPYNDDAQSVLEECAIWLQRTGTSPEFIGFYRLCITEARRFPEISQLGYTCMRDGLFVPCEDVLRTLGDRGLLEIPDTKMAAEHFCSAILGTRIWRQLLERPADVDIVSKKYISQVVDMFKRAYAITP